MSVAYVRRVLLKLTTDRHEASRGLFATAELIIIIIIIIVFIEIKLTNATCYNDTKQAVTQDSTALYNRTQSFDTQAFKSTKYNTSFSTEL